MRVHRIAGDHDGARIVDDDFDGPCLWTWTDIDLGTATDHDAFDDLIRHLGLDPLATSDAFHEHNLPKVNDFADHLLVVIHGVSDEFEPTYEIDCFVTANVLVTVRRHRSPSIEAFTSQLCRSPELAAGGPCEILARLSDVVCRRFLARLDQLDDQVDDLTAMALRADPDYLETLTMVREHAGDLRHVLRPQREVFDQLRRTPSTIVTDAGRRRFSDVFDIAQRSVRELDSARGSLSETLGAYQGAEARLATDVTKVLTVYAAVLLPLSLIAGIFGMNFVNIPGGQDPNGWWITVGLMAATAICSLGVFGAVGWIRIRRPRSLRHRLPSGASRIPVQLADGLFRSATTRAGRPSSNRSATPRRTAPHQPKK